MEKSRSLFQEIIGYKMLFVFFLLFNTDILVDGQTAIQPVSTEIVIASTEMSSHFYESSPTLVFPNPTVFSNVSTVSVKSPPEATTSSTPSIRPTVHQTASLMTTLPVSKQKIIHSPTAINTTTPGDTSTQNKSAVPTVGNVTFTMGKSHQVEAVVVQESSTSLGPKNVSSEKTVTPDFDTNVGQKASPPTKDFGKSSPEPTPSKSTGPRQEETEITMSGPDILQFNPTPVTGSYHPPHLSTPSTTSVSKAPEIGSSDPSTSKKNHTAIILAVVFSLLLLAGLLTFLYCRHRHRSGSTNFNAPEWAGQAALPDDSGLDKDVEHEAGAVGEGEARRGTLVTFFEDKRGDVRLDG
ncbi:mucin-2-like [Python bivittatus]|uniref:Mucin-2-like n=1 Tax=Python bivittatus TaxID=176946 RepID=A0A9F5N014_PYTBI|nr:mucin-2-like [Python bivittatus]